MGRLKSYYDHSGKRVNGVLLGYPVEFDDDPTTFEWDDERIPDGWLDEDGNIIPK